MEDTIYQTKTVSATYSTEEKLVCLCWTSEANTEEYRQIFQFLIDFTQKSRVRFVISDIRKEGLVSIDNLKWLEEEILTKAILMGIEKIAIINEDTIFSNVYAENIERKLRDSIIKVQLFDDLATAKTWMTAK